jgi:integrase
MADTKHISGLTLAERVNNWLAARKCELTELVALNSGRVFSDEEMRRMIDGLDPRGPGHQIDLEEAIARQEREAAAEGLERLTFLASAFSGNSDHIKSRTNWAMMGFDPKWRASIEPEIDAACAAIAPGLDHPTKLAVLRREIARGLHELHEHLGQVYRGEDEPHPMMLEPLEPEGQSVSNDADFAEPIDDRAVLETRSSQDGAGSQPPAPPPCSRDSGGPPRPNMTLSQVIPIYLADAMPRKGERKSDLGLTATTAAQAKSSLALLLAIVGDKTLGSITSTDGANFRLTMRALPGAYYHAKVFRPLYEERNIDGLVVAREALEQKNPNDPLAARMTAKTFNKHYSAISTFTKWAKANGYLDRKAEFFLEGQFIDIETTPDHHPEQRSSWSQDDLSRLFASPLFTGMESHSRWLRAGTFLARDERYWLPLMSACLGTRIDELAQLRVKHIRQTTDDPSDPVRYVDLKDPTLHLKEAASRRVIPLHRYLIELGFIEDRVLGRDPDEYLFPEIVAANALGKRSAPFVRFFDRVCESLGIAKTLHEFRNTVITQLFKKTRRDHSAHCEAITGHASKTRSTMFVHYTDDMLIRELKPVVDLIELPIDIDALKRAVNQHAKLTP